MTLTGAMGWLGRAWGFAANKAESVQLVDAHGLQRTVTSTSDPELFWALHGGGGDFGIVTAMEPRQTFASAPSPTWDRPRTSRSCWPRCARSVTRRWT
jgi:FAD/FMN-containing dehydrogenase